MSVLVGLLGMARARADARMTETLEFFTINKTEDPETLQPVTVEMVVGSTPGRVKFSSSVWSDKEIAGQAPVTATREVHVPVGSVSVGPSVMVRVVSSLSDPGLVGRVFRTGMRAEGGQVSAWRYPVEEVS